MTQITVNDLKDAIEKIPDGILMRYADNIFFGSYPVVRGQLFDVLIVKDGTKRILLAVHYGRKFLYWTENEDHPLVKDFLTRTDWKQYWCIV